MTDERTEHQIPEMRELAREAQPPAGLEERTVAQLRALNLIASPPIAGVRWHAWRWVAAVAGAAVFFAAGWVTRQAAIPAAPSAVVNTNPRFLLLLRPGQMQESSAEVEAERVREYGEWGGELRAKGQLLSAAKLDDAVRLLTAAGEAAANFNAGTFPGAHGSVQGFFLISAPSLEEAAAVARTCPHLRYGGVIEVRPTVAR